MYNIESINLSLLAGTNLDDSIKQAIQIAYTNNCKVYFNFNGVPLFVTKLSDKTQIKSHYYYYLDAQKGMKND